MHKNKAWKRLSDTDKAEYKALHDEFIRTSAAMLRKFEKNGGEELEKEITDYLESADSKRATLEVRAKYKWKRTASKTAFCPFLKLSDYLAHFISLIQRRMSLNIPDSVYSTRKNSTRKVRLREALNPAFKPGHSPFRYIFAVLCGSGKQIDFSESVIS